MNSQLKKKYYDIKITQDKFDKINNEFKVSYKIDYLNDKNEVVYTSERSKSLYMMIKFLEEDE